MTDEEIKLRCIEIIISHDNSYNSADSPYYSWDVMKSRDLILDANILYEMVKQWVREDKIPDC